MLVKRIAAYTHHLSSTVYELQRDIGRNSEIATFPTTIAFNAPVGVFPLEFRGKVWSS